MIHVVVHARSRMGIQQDGESACSIRVFDTETVSAAFYNLPLGKCFALLQSVSWCDNSNSIYFIQSI